MLGEVVALLILVIYVSFKWVYSYWNRHGVEGPAPVPIFGNLFQYVMGKKHFGEVYGKIYRSFPTAKYVGVYKMYEPALLIRDLDLVNDVLVKKFNNFMQNDFFVNAKLDPLVAENPFVKTGDLWKESRSQVTPLFTMSRVRQTSPIVTETCQKLVSYIDKNCGKDLEMKDLFYRYTMENLMSCGLGLNAECFTNEDSEFFKRGMALFEPNLYKNLAILFVPWLSKIFDIRFVSANTDHWIRSIVNQVMARREKTQEVRNDFLDNIIHAKKNDFKGMTENMIVGHCMTFFTEGTETSSITLTYAFYELARNHQIQEKVFNEIKEVLGNSLDMEKIQDLKYLDQFLNEVMRIHPTVFTMTKICQKDTEIEAQYDDGKKTLTVKPGTRVIIPVREIHHDPLNYENPEIFDPERFSKENIGKIPKMAFIPFGEGPRICLGKTFALFQVKYALVYVLANFKAVLSPKMTGPPEISKRAFILHCDSGIWVQFEKRK